MSRLLKLTSVGLPIRKELLVKSFLQIVGARTIDSWSFCDGIDAHVAICDSASALTAVVRKFSQGKGLPYCVDLVSDSDEAVGDKAYALRDPIRVTELIELLNTISAKLDLDGRDDHNGHTGKPDAGAIAHNDRPTAAHSASASFGLVVHQLIGEASREVHTVEAGGVTLHVIPAARALLSKDALDEQFMPLLLKSSYVRVSKLGEERAQRLIAEGATPRPIDGLLWRAGLEGAHSRQHSALTDNAKFALRRWPDFGRLKHDSGHVRMAAHLVRTAYGIDQLAAATGQSIDQARAFINACALCDLIDIRAPAPTPIVAIPQVAAAATGWGGIFKSIRSALGLGGA